MNRGGRSTAFAQNIARNRSAGNAASFDLYIQREATLDERLSTVETRSVRSLVLVLKPGYDGEQEIRISRGMAAALCAGLEKALRETDEETWL